MAGKKTCPRTCETCGSRFLISARELARGRGRFCSRGCLCKANARALPIGATGPENPNWKGGVSRQASRYKKRYRARHPEAAKAHDEVYNAKRRKTARLVPQPCEGCGATRGVHAHHDDYSKPLQVRWLCGSCHRQQHGASC